MDHRLGDVTIEDFLGTLRAAAAGLDDVYPEALREPLRLWFRAVEEEARREGWAHLLGRPVVAVWNAARAVLDHAPVAGAASSGEPLPSDWDE